MRCLYKNGIFHSGKTDQDTFSYLLVKNGIIEGTYDKKPEIRCKEVDLEGRHVYPCFIDGHIHLLHTLAVLAMGFEVCNITKNGIEPSTLAGAEQKIREYCKDKSENAVIAVNNYISSAIEERRLPTSHELDDWAGGRAIVVYNIDGHSCALSSKMLELTGIQSETGILIGEENERNQGKITDAVAGAINISSLIKGVRNFNKECAAYGIGMVGALEGNGDSKNDIVTRLLMFLSRFFKARCEFYYQFMDIERAEKLSRGHGIKRIGGCGDWEMDGSVGSKTAAFNNDQCYYSQSFVDEKVAAADRRGFQIASHAIGPAAIKRILTALNKTSGKTYHRVEHVEFIDDEGLEMLDGKKYAVMMQPGYGWIDKRYLHTYEQNLNKDILDNIKLKSIADKGVRICASSDSPVQSMNPFLQVLGMTDFYVKEESLNIYDAFASYTINPAKAMLLDNKYGTLEKGKRADFFTSRKNLFEQSSEDLMDFKIENTYYGGKRFT